MKETGASSTALGLEDDAPPSRAASGSSTTPSSCESFHLSKIWDSMPEVALEGGTSLAPFLKETRIHLGRLSRQAPHAQGSRQPSQNSGDKLWPIPPPFPRAWGFDLKDLIKVSDWGSAIQGFVNLLCVVLSWIFLGKPTDIAKYDPYSQLNSHQEASVSLFGEIVGPWGELPPFTTPDLGRTA